MWDPIFAEEYRVVSSCSQTDSFAFVLYLNQKMSDEGTRAAEQFTRELIEATLQYGGITFLTSDRRREHRFERPIRSWTPSSRRKRSMTPTAFLIIRSSSISERRKGDRGQKSPVQVERERGIPFLIRP